MPDATYYVKRVRRNDDGNITHFKTSKELQGRADKVRKRKKVAKHVKKGKNIHTAYLDDGQWVDGDKIVRNKSNHLRTEGNRTDRDNIGSLKSF